MGQVEHDVAEVPPQHGERGADVIAGDGLAFLGTGGGGEDAQRAAVRQQVIVEAAAVEPRSSRLPVAPQASPMYRLDWSRDPALAAAIADISASEIRATDSVLVSFGTRHTMSDTLSDTRGIGAARRYLFSKLQGYSQACGGCLRVEYDPAMMEIRGHPQRPTVNIVNVVAWLPGRDTSRVLVMGGHYDSCVCSRTDLGALARFEATQDAPGADDDGSGTSAVVELARVFSKHFPRSRHR